MKCRSDFHDDGEYRDYLRTYFAGLAMQSYIYNVRRSEHEPDEKLQKRIAILSVQMTDALLKALETKTE